MGITSLDILNLSHSLKDICEVNCKSSDCLSQTLKFLLQYNLLQANLSFSEQFDCSHRPHGEPFAHNRPPLREKENCIGLDIANPNAVRD